MKWEAILDKRKTLLNRRQFLVGGISAAMVGPTQAMAPKTGFILIGASWCPVCHRAAPVLAMFAQNLGAPVLVASADSRPIAPFEKFVPAQDHPIASAVNAYPTTLVFSGNSNHIVSSIEGYRNPKFYMKKLLDAVSAIENGRA
ncbi:hypothetical protein MXMO3_03515 (plasmid) [Maritalea myrionectae]|uniref:Thioredoxin domain-containing protein n=1 Tax=Maritalea myrionectae TaxID=454601 RepID=A0A2R4MJ65_9HYPH|nr:hypothetical protein MXMO3_03515 [Maritalea myrionectae]